MEKLSVSKEFVLAAHAASKRNGCELANRIEKEFPGLFKVKIELGKWYIWGEYLFRTNKMERKDECVVCDNSNFGNDCTHSIGMDSAIGKDWRLATKEEIEKHLAELWVKRGGKEGVTVKRAHLKDNNETKKITTVCSGDPLYCYYKNEDRFRVLGNTVYVDGQWAEIISEPQIVEITMDEIAKLKGCDVSQLKIKK